MSRVPRLPGCHRSHLLRGVHLFRGRVNVYIFRFYSKYFEDKLDKKAAAIWTEMKEHLGDRLGGQQRAGSSLDEVL